MVLEQTVCSKKEFTKGMAASVVVDYGYDDLTEEALEIGGETYGE